ncbi:MAG: hypothetical protein C4555_03220 [Dehalococcoidia bacterium]|nr:MAG: hypothetical protein C4555_03220 [Dehalococcoidia bacterium]
MTTLLTILGLLKTLFEVIKGFMGKSKKDSVIEANQKVTEAREGQAKSDMKVSVLKAEVAKEHEKDKSLEEIKNETEY